MRVLAVAAALLGAAVIFNDPSDPVERARLELSRRLRCRSEDIEVLGTSEAMAPDLGLGCPAVGEAYADVLTPYTAIHLRYSGQDYEIRIGSGVVRYCWQE